MRAHGDGGIERRGKTSWRLRYRIGKVRYEKTFSGTLKEAKTELRKLLRSGDTGEHVAPDNATLAVWAKQWIEAGAPGRKRQAVGARAIENYDQLLRSHVLPILGEHKLQQIFYSTDIDKLYLSLEGKIAPRTARHVHSVFNACLGAAVKSGSCGGSTQWRTPPRCPPPGESDHGIALDEEQLRKLVQGFKGSALYAIVGVAAFTGARQGEILALRWSESPRRCGSSGRSRTPRRTVFASRAPRNRATSAPSRSTMICWRCSWSNARSICD